MLLLSDIFGAFANSTRGFVDASLMVFFIELVVRALPTSEGTAMKMHFAGIYE